MLRHSSILVKRSSASGLTLVELLVVLAIIATLAGIVYPAIISSIQKSEAAMAAQRIDAVEKAKVQYRLEHQDDPGFDPKNVTFDAYRVYLIQLGQPINDQKSLSDGTGGTLFPETLANTAYFRPTDTSDTFRNLLLKYHVPSDAAPEADPGANSSGTASSQ